MERGTEALAMAGTLAAQLGEPAIEILDPAVRLGAESAGLVRRLYKPNKGARDGQVDRQRVRQPQRRHGGAGRREDAPAHRLDLQVDLRRGPLRLQAWRRSKRRARCCSAARPTRASPPPGPSARAPFADKINSMPKYVVSSTLTDPEWENTTVLSGDPVAAGARAEGDRRRARSCSTAAPSSPTR